MDVKKTPITPLTQLHTTIHSTNSKDSNKKQKHVTLGTCVCLNMLGYAACKSSQTFTNKAYDEDMQLCIKINNS